MQCVLGLNLSKKSIEIGLQIFMHYWVITSFLGIVAGVFAIQSLLASFAIFNCAVYPRQTPRFVSRPARHR
jgi:hypothetical protein